MKVFFISTPRGKQELGDSYEKVYDVIKRLGYTHVSDFISRVEPDDFYKYTHEERVEHYKNTLASLKKADILVVETSIHSLAIGHITNLALGMGKPVIALHLTGKSPYFLSGVEDERLQVVEYSDKEIDKTLGAALKYATDQMDTRFNFFISPRIGNYLDWVAKHKKLPRAVYLRKLIERDMEANKDFKD